MDIVVVVLKNDRNKLKHFHENMKKSKECNPHQFLDSLVKAMIVDSTSLNEQVCECGQAPGGNY